MQKSLLLLCLCSSVAVAAVPPSHPTVEQAAEVMQLPHNPNLDQLPNRAEVLQSIPSNEYVYVEVKNANGQFWLAAPRVELHTGDKIRFSNGSLMRNFYSKKLQRTFDAVWFVSKVEVLNE